MHKQATETLKSNFESDSENKSAVIVKSQLLAFMQNRVSCFTSKKLNTTVEQAFSGQRLTEAHCKADAEPNVDKRLTGWYLRPRDSPDYQLSEIEQHFRYHLARALSE